MEPGRPTVTNPNSQVRVSWATLFFGEKMCTEDGQREERALNVERRLNIQSLGRVRHEQTTEQLTL